MTHAWAAGFIDGEGCIQINRWCRPNGRTRYTLDFEVGQRVPKPLLCLQQLYGGVVKWRPGRKAWVWRARSGTAARALEAMLPHLVLKKDEAEAALLFHARRLALGDWRRKHAPPLQQHAHADEMSRIELQRLKRRTA